MVSLALYHEAAALLRPLVEASAKATVAPLLASLRKAAAAAAGAGGAASGDDDGFVIVAHSDGVDARASGGAGRSQRGARRGGAAKKRGCAPRDLITRDELATVIARLLGEHMRRDLGYDAAEGGAGGTELEHEHSIGGATAVKDEHGEVCFYLPLHFKRILLTI